MPLVILYVLVGTGILQAGVVIHKTCINSESYFQIEYRSQVPFCPLLFLCWMERQRTTILTLAKQEIVGSKNLMKLVYHGRAPTPLGLIVCLRPTFRINSSDIYPNIVPISMIMRFPRHYLPCPSLLAKSV